MPGFAITDVMFEQYNRDGYLLAPSLFDTEEMDLLLKTARSDRAIEENAMSLDDGAGGVSRLSLWYHPGDDLYGMFSRCRRIVDGAEKLVGHPLLHYHSKMMLKEPFTGGSWAWHQDYGYWYLVGYLFPDMISCTIAVDGATRENGCLQVLKGSHRMGRINHATTGDQVGADPKRVEWAMGRFELVHCEMQPGDALFFHCNLLHCSAQNRSARSRWSLICCYTAAHNEPCDEPQHPGYQPLVKVPDSAIKEVGSRGATNQNQFMKFDRAKLYDR